MPQESGWYRGLSGLVPFGMGSFLIAASQSPDLSETLATAYDPGMCLLALLVIDETVCRKAAGSSPLCFTEMFGLRVYLKQERSSKKMKEKLEQIKAEATAQIQAADIPEKLNDVRVKFLGKKGELTAVLKGMKDVAPEDRPKIGQLVNDTRAAIEEMLEERKMKMERAIREQKMKEEVIDVTLPSRKNLMGHRHPNTIAQEEVERIFVGMGYEVVEGPEVEYDEYNFEKLNIPADHPAKDEQDTFYINKEIVLRTQTSPVQARVMEQGKLPIRIISPGRVFFLVR